MPGMLTVRASARPLTSRRTQRNAAPHSARAKRVRYGSAAQAAGFSRVILEGGNRQKAEWFQNGAQGRNRTTDTAIFSRMLYQLSYLGTADREGDRVGGG